MTQRLVSPDERIGRALPCREVKTLLKSVEFGRGVEWENHKDAASIKVHVTECQKCGEEYRLALLKRAILGATKAEVAGPEESFFAGVTARINRESERRPQPGQVEPSWPVMVWVTARQLVPIMAVVLLMIVGATLMWGGPVSRSSDSAALRPSDKVLFHDVLEYPQPTPDDALDILVAVEETTNGK